MSHVIAVVSPDDQLVKFYLDKCIAVMRGLTGLPIRDSKRTTYCGAATFAHRRRAGESSNIHESPDGHNWAAGLGTWFCADNAPEEKILTNLMSASENQTLLKILTGTDGCFVFVISRSNGRNVQVLTDRVGSLHAYLSRIGETTIISTSALALAKVTHRAFNLTAVREFLAIGTVFEDRSLFEKIYKVAPATIINFDQGLLRKTSRYWSLPEDVQQNLSPSIALSQFATAVRDSVAQILHRFRRPAFDLTGGFDSRILLSTALTLSSAERLSTVVTGPQAHPDVICAGDIARYLGLRHLHIDPSEEPMETRWKLVQMAIPMTDGEADVFDYARTLMVHRRLAEQFDASINGSGGELIRGYWWELLFPHIGSYRSLNAQRVARARFATDSWAEELFGTIFTETLSAHFAGVIERSNTSLHHARNVTYLDNIYLLLRMQRWQGRLASATNQLWPSVSPFLFRRPLELAMQAPTSLRRNAKMARLLMMHLNPDLARLPMAGGYPALPLNVRTAHLFFPLGREYAQRAGTRLSKLVWGASATRTCDSEAFSNLSIGGRAMDYLSPSSMLTAELYNRHALSNLLLSSPTGNTRAAWKLSRLLTLELSARLLADQVF